jgi:hypothetical protein
MNQGPRGDDNVEGLAAAVVVATVTRGPSDRDGKIEDLAAQRQPSEYGDVGDNGSSPTTAATATTGASHVCSLLLISVGSFRICNRCITENRTLRTVH